MTEVEFSTKFAENISTFRQDTRRAENENNDDEGLEI